MLTKTNSKAIWINLRFLDGYADKIVFGKIFKNLGKGKSGAIFLDLNVKEILYNADADEVDLSADLPFSKLVTAEDLYPIGEYEVFELILGRGLYKGK